MNEDTLKKLGKRLQYFIFRDLMRGGSPRGAQRRANKMALRWLKKEMRKRKRANKNFLSAVHRMGLQAVQIQGKKDE